MKIIIIYFILLSTVLYSKPVNLTKKEQIWIKNNIVKIGIEQWKPIVYLDKNNKINGLSGDILNLVIKRLNLKTEIINNKWDRLLNDFKEHKIDILPATYYTKQRDTYGTYSDEYVKIKEYIYVKNSNATIKNFENLKGKKVAIIKDYGTIPKIMKKYPSIKIIQTKDLEDSINKLLNNEVEALVDVQLSIENYIHDNMVVGIKGIAQNSFKSAPLYLFSNTKIPILNNILNKGLKSITSKEKSEFIYKWLNKANDIQNLDFLTNNEKLYLKEKRIIKMCNNPNLPPFEFTKNGDINKMEGITIDILNILENKLNIKFKNVATKSWSESQQFLKDNKCEILPFAVKNKERTKYANFTKPYLTLPLAIFTQKNQNIVNGLDDLIGKTISIKSGSSMIPILKAKYKDIKIKETFGVIESLQAVNNGNAYYTISNIPTVSYYMSQSILNNLQISGYMNITASASIAVNNNDEILLTILNKSLSTISQEQSRQIFKKWVGTTLEKTIVDYTIVWNILSVVGIIIIFFIYRQYILKKSNNALGNLVDIKTQELQTLNEDLEQKILKEVEKNKHIQEQLFKSEKMASMGEMIENIAHQWRQPLSVISTASTGIIMQKEFNILKDDKLIDTCNIINTNAQYLSKTIDDFRNFIKGDRVKRIFKLEDEINIFLNLIDSTVKNNNITIILNLEKDIQINGYANELIQCFMNIVNNSKDALKEGSEDNSLIFISTKLENNNIVIKIKDNASGIPKDIKSKIFEPYFTTKHKSQGTGLGLHMTYNLIVDGMNGMIDVNNIKYTYKNKEYIGAEFTINLPTS